LENRRFVPCVDGSELARRIFTARRWSVQPCVRPVSAVHKTAGHNALRGSGPGQKPAFDNALAHVGCPDRRIDRLCITCCSSSQPSHHAGCPARSAETAACRARFIQMAHEYRLATLRIELSSHLRPGNADHNSGTNWPSDSVNFSPTLLDHPRRIVSPAEAWLL
jgi:hypothetical protein